MTEAIEWQKVTEALVYKLKKAIYNVTVKNVYNIERHRTLKDTEGWLIWMTKTDMSSSWKKR